MAFFPVTISAAKMPRTLIMAIRPLLISLLRISSLYMSMPKGSPKLPGSRSSSCLHTSSMMPLAIKRMNSPKVTLPLARAPKVPDAFGKSKIGNLKKGWPIAPMDAIIATRPCLISAARSLLKPFSSPTLVKPRGSKKPSGSTAPICAAGSNGGGATGSSGAPSSTSAGVAVASVVVAAAIEIFFAMRAIRPASPFEILPRRFILLTPAKAAITPAAALAAAAEGVPDVAAELVTTCLLTSDAPGTFE
mmetsp:Transcript_41336/g.97104  ORF Transcript_41336/g.97104 Transcript_41336/m.97104 type:complete len:248 (+) Transcript_41336:715-1458(+)